MPTAANYYTAQRIAIYSFVCDPPAIPFRQDLIIMPLLLRSRRQNQSVAVTAISTITITIVLIKTQKPARELILACFPGLAPIAQQNVH